MKWSVTEKKDENEKLIIKYFQALIFNKITILSRQNKRENKQKLYHHLCAKFAHFL